MGGESAPAVLAKGVVDFLGRICNPAADEIGFLLKDKVAAYRSKNFTSILKKAEEKISEKSEGDDPEIHPRMLYSIFEHGAWADSDVLQEMWAGLLASSCFNGVSDKNIIYVDIMSKMSAAEARLFEYVAINSEWKISDGTALPESSSIFPNVSQVLSVCDISNADELDEVLSHLKALGVIFFEEYPDIESYTKTSEAYKSDIHDEEFYNPRWGHAIELALTQIGCRLYLKAIGETAGLREYIQQNFPADNNHDEDDY